jgi:hypothetical protein
MTELAKKNEKMVFPAAALCPGRGTAVATLDVEYPTTRRLRHERKKNQTD